MEKKGLSQEGLKIVACVTMLIDHVGAVFFPSQLYLRLIGRIAFPIYCFLLVEGTRHTKDPIKYGLRLLIGLLLSEIPFDYALHGSFTWKYQSVMVTLLIGYLCISLIAYLQNGFLKLLVAMAGYAAAKYARTDYGGNGVVLIILFSQIRNEAWIQTVIIYAAALLMRSVKMKIGEYMIPVEMFAIFAAVPMACYTGEKRTQSKLIQWVFYLFYPGHLALIWILKFLLKI